MASYFLFIELTFLGFMLAFKERKRYADGERKPSVWMFLSILCMSGGVMQGADTILPTSAKHITGFFSVLGLPPALVDASALLAFWGIFMMWCFAVPVVVAEGWEGFKKELML